MKTRTKILIFLVIIVAFFNVSIFVSPALGGDDEDDIKDDIDDVEEELEDAQKDLQNLNAANQTVTIQINSTSYKIDQTEKEITRQESEIEALENRIKLNQSLLQDYLRELYWNHETDDLIEMTVFKDSWQKIVLQSDSLLTTKEKLLTLINEINSNKAELEGKKEELEDTKEEHEELLETKQAERNVIQSNITETNLTIADLQAKLTKLRRVLSSFLGEDYDLDDVIDAVEYADKKTGVRKEFLFAMLDKETDLGRFTGGCYYSKGSNPVKSHMKDADRDAFKDIMDDLGYDKNDKKLSCWPGYGYGGAMGIAQFMPTTWNGWKDKIADKTDNDPANPWRLEDGVMGMALKLEAAGADKKSKEHYAAKVYYCGGPSSPYWDNRCEAYADTVISWSDGYDEYFD